MAVKVISIGRPPYSDSLLEELRNFPVIFHPDPTLDSFEVLHQNGVQVKPIENQLPDGSILLLLPATGQLERLVQIGNRLLAPDGCPWDREQTHVSLKKYLLEETYELCDAIDSTEPNAIIEELGDVLLQPIMHSAMGARDGQYSIDEVGQAICEKLIRRHPHVFANISAEDSATVLKNWDAIKRTEKLSLKESTSILDGVPSSAPALVQGLEVTIRAARQGFEWKNIDDVWLKLSEELVELHNAIATESSEHVSDELGDVLFTIINIARWLGVNPEESLRNMVIRFKERFLWMENHCTSALSELSASEWDALWKQAKASISA